MNSYSVFIFLWRAMILFADSPGIKITPCIINISWYDLTCNCVGKKYKGEICRGGQCMYTRMMFWLDYYVKKSLHATVAFPNIDFQLIVNSLHKLSVQRGFFLRKLN